MSFLPKLRTLLSCTFKRERTLFPSLPFRSSCLSLFILPLFSSSILLSSTGSIIFPKWSLSFLSNSLPPHGLQPTRLLRPWDFPGKSTGVGCHCFLQRIFLTQGSNPDIPHCRQKLCHLSHPRKSFSQRKWLSSKESSVDHFLMCLGSPGENCQSR